MTDSRNELIKEAGRLEEDVLYSEKAHFGMATVWNRLHLVLGIPSGIAAAASGVAALNTEPLIAVGLAAGSTILTALLTFLGPKSVAATHHNAGISYGALRGQLRRLRLIDLPAAAEVGDFRKTIEDLAVKKQEIMKSSPHIGGLAYVLSKRSIGRNEHDYIVDQPQIP